jgi:3-oxoacyl-[acyl-carrier protein] reductase
VSGSRSIFLTGAAGGLGRGLAEAFFGAGYRVALADLSSDIEEVATALDPGLARALPLRFDVSEEAAFRAAFETAVRRFGQVDVLVNNAARTIARPLWDIPISEWDEVMAANLRSCFIGSRLAGRHMRERGVGRIVNIASISGQVASPGAGAHYAASKGGMLALTRVFALELAGSGVTVNAVSPSAIESPLFDAASPERRERLLAAVPLGRPGRVSEVAAAVLHLASDEAGYTTGTTLDVNGGRLMR